MNFFFVDGNTVWTEQLTAQEKRRRITRRCGYCSFRSFVQRIAPRMRVQLCEHFEASVATPRGDSVRVLTQLIRIRSKFELILCLLEARCFVLIVRFLV